MTQSPPNILVIMADQLAPHFVGGYGNSVAKTPNIDALIARGARFDGAYCNSPLCSPSRASFMAGQHVSKTKTYDNAAEFAASIPTYAHYLNQMGYKTCLAGRMHFVGPDQLHGFQTRVTTDVYPADFAWTPDWTKPDERIDSWYHDMSSVKEAGPAVTTFQIDYDEEVGYAARKQLLDYARDRDHPFCMVASFMHPHDPYVARPEFWDLYEEGVDMPEVPADFEALDAHSRRVADGVLATTTQVSEDDIQTSRRGYYANTSYFDSKVGELVATLEETGLIDTTVVVIISDHGDMLGDKGLWYKMTFLEKSARIPLVMAGPGVKHLTHPNACSLVDLAPTFMEIAALGGAEIPTPGMPLGGRSLWAAATGGEDSDDVAIGEYCAEMASQPGVMIRRGALKFIHQPGDPDLLFDVLEDPHELRNLVDEPTYAEALAGFRQEIAEGWDLEALRKDILLDQAKRHAIHKGMEAGGGTDWDHTPPRNARDEYVRNHMDWNVASTRFRIDPANR